MGVRCLSQIKGVELWIRVFVIKFWKKGHEFTEVSQALPISVGCFLVDGFKLDFDASSEELVNVLDCLQGCCSIALQGWHRDDLDVVLAPSQFGVVVGG